MRTKGQVQGNSAGAEWDAIGSLYQKLLHWLYKRADQRKASLCAQRLKPLLTKADPRHESIFGEECWSLVHEANGDLERAIVSRENEISLIRRLRRLSVGKPYEKAALKGYGWDDLADRLDLLATLYHKKGDLDKAIDVLLESKKACERHGVRFDGEDLLQEYLGEEGIREPHVTAETAGAVIEPAFVVTVPPPNYCFQSSQTQRETVSW
jgi:hypothetical protein